MTLIHGDLVGLSLDQSIVTVRLGRHPNVADEELARVLDGVGAGVRALMPHLGAVLLDLSNGPNAVGEAMRDALGKLLSELDAHGVPLVVVHPPTPLGKLQAGRVLSDFAPHSGAACSDEVEGRRVLLARAKPPGSFEPRARSHDSGTHAAVSAFTSPTRNTTARNPFADGTRSATGRNPLATSSAPPGQDPFRPGSNKPKPSY